MIIRNANVFKECGWFELDDIYIEDAQFVSKTTGKHEVMDGSNLFAIPGLVDIHFHGCVNYDFCDGTPESLKAIAKYEASCGVTAIAPASMTLPEEILLKIFKNAANYKQQDGAALVGINMEGPFLSEKKKGAQNSSYLHKPDMDMFKRLEKAADGLIKLVDVAPEEPGALEFINELKNTVTVSIAHTTADYNTAKIAFEAGASHVTHLYNAMPVMTNREPGVVGAACDHPNCRYVELICDGIHIHPAMVRNTFKMFGDDRIVLISDSMMATGMPDGQYALGGQPVRKDGNRAVIMDTGTLAGSVTNLMDCLRTAVKEMEIPLEKAVKCATMNPAKAIGIYDKYGSITPGKTANLVLLNKDLEIKNVILNGIALL